MGVCWGVAATLGGAVLATLLAGLALLRPPLNRCAMTFMYQIPQFIPVPMGTAAEHNFPEYRLLVYGEGLYAEHVKTMDLDGIPVLFIPGNAGSYRQVRSLGSVALTKSGKDPKLPIFNFFTLDFDEQLSGLYGGYAWNQTKFLDLAIRAVFKLYSNSPRPPKRLVLVGHSVGGLVARGLFMLPGFDADVVQLLITQATPHRGPVLKLDGGLELFSDMVEGFWAEEATKKLAHLSAVSIGGGSDDLIVRSHLTTWPDRLRQYVDRDKRTENRLSLWEASGEGLDGVWAAMDHLCVVWCKQLVLATTRALFDLADPKTQQITTNRSRMAAVLDWHFGGGGRGPKSIWESEAGPRRFPPQRDLRQLSTKLGQAQVVRTSPRSVPGVLYRAFVHAGLVGRRLFALTTQRSDGLAFLCHQDQGCGLAEALPGLRHAPPHSRYQHLDVTAEMEGRSVVLPSSFHAPTQSSVFLAYDPEDPKYHGERTAFWWEFLIPFRSYTYTFPKGEAFFNLTLRGVVSLIQVYELGLEASDCDEEHEDAEISAVSVRYDGQLSESYHRHFRIPYNVTDNLIMRRQLLQPGDFGSAEVELLLNPACAHRFEMALRPMLGLGEVLRHFSAALPCLVAFQLLLHLAYLNYVDQSGSCLDWTDLGRRLVGFHVAPLLRLLSTSTLGLDFPVAMCLCSFSAGIVVVGFGLPLAISRFAARRHASGSRDATQNGVTRVRKTEEQTRKFPLGEADLRLSIFAVAVLGFVGNWAIPGQPIIVVGILVHLALFVRDLWSRPWDQRRQIEALLLSIAVLQTALLAPSIIIWSKTALTRWMLGLEMLAMDPSRRAALLLVGSLTAPSHRSLLPLRYAVPLGLAVVVGASGPAAFPVVAELLAVALGLGLNRNWRAPTASERKRKGH